MHITQFRLTPHPQSRSAAVDKVEGAIYSFGPSKLVIKYLVVGRVRNLAIPVRTTRRQRDGLWQQTCFEAFLRRTDGNRYYEFNFSPTLEWAAYRFDSYRSGQTAMGELPDPFITRRDGSSACWELRARIDPSLIERTGGGPWQLGVSAILEETNGIKTYWALAHPPGPPDFHHRDCFALELPPT